MRIRQYFDKIKDIENPPEPRDKKLDVQASIRFIKANTVSDSGHFSTSQLHLLT